MLGVFQTLGNCFSHYFQDGFAAVHRLTNTSWIEKLVMSCFFSVTVAVLRCENSEDFVDKFVGISIYIWWCTYLLPGIVSKLTCKMLWDITVTVTTLFAADMLYHGLYVHAKPHVVGSEVDVNNMDQRILFFFMSSVRIFVILFCLATTCSSFVQRTFRNTWALRRFRIKKR